MKLFASKGDKFQFKYAFGKPENRNENENKCKMSKLNERLKIFYFGQSLIYYRFSLFYWMDKRGNKEKQQ